MTADKFLTYYNSGGLKYFAPNEAAEREDVAVAMIKAMGLNVDDADLSYLDSFTDKNDISEKLRPYIALAIEYGVMNGTGNNKFSPRRSVNKSPSMYIVCKIFTRTQRYFRDQVNGEGCELVEYLLMNQQPFYLFRS
jgi:hypothetical protein